MKINFCRCFIVEMPELGLNKIQKIKLNDQNEPKGIYIHRYENPLLSVKKKKSI